MWSVLTQIPCKDIEPSTANCIKVTTMAKEFTNRDKAIEFFDIGNYNEPLSMTIDSVLIKPRK